MHGGLRALMDQERADEINPSLVDHRTSVGLLLFENTVKMTHIIAAWLLSASVNLFN